MNNFITSLFYEILNNLHNNFDRNEEFEIQNIQPVRQSIFKRIKKYFLSKRYLYIKRVHISSLINSINMIEPYIESLRKTYNILCDDYSRNLYIQLLTYRILGYTKVKLPLNNKEYWKTINDINKIKFDEDDYIDTKFRGLKLYKYNFKKIGFSIEMYSIPGGVYTIFIAKQYEYSKNACYISATNGNIVIDAGGC